MMSPEGGIMDLETGRQMYFLGKLVKKATRAVKKVADSPLGKIALIGGLSFGIPGTKIGGLFGRAKFGGDAMGLFGTKGIGPLFTNLMGGKISPNINDEVALTGKQNILQKALGKINPFTAITAASTIAGLLTPAQEAEAQRIADETGIDIDEIRANFDKYQARRFKADGGIMRLGYQEGGKDLSEDPNYKGWLKLYEKNPDAAAINENHEQYLNFYKASKNEKADGGRIEYQEGSKEPVAKKTMPLLDMDGMEKDYRETGGFVDIGRMERADDVPARLSKNEFVFTADAVRNAGEGDIDKGAEVMYNMMKNLEAGGEVSEESQGLEGARRMFQTSQRLEEVL
jgi:hypothetical protein